MAGDVFPTILVLFGATGDLVQRKIIPALWQLYQADRLPPLLQIVGYARREITDADWQAQVRQQLGETPGEAAAVEKFSRLFFYPAPFF